MYAVKILAAKTSFSQFYSSCRPSILMINRNCWLVHLPFWMLWNIADHKPISPTKSAQAFHLNFSDISAYAIWKEKVCGYASIFFYHFHKRGNNFCDSCVSTVLHSPYKMGCTLKWKNLLTFKQILPFDFTTQSKRGKMKLGELFALKMYPFTFNTYLLGESWYYQIYLKYSETVIWPTSILSKKSCPLVK